MVGLSGALRRMAGGAALAVALMFASGASAQTRPVVAEPAVAGPVVAGVIQWGIWIDDDGCHHYWADGGLEGYMVDRVNPRTGKPVCMKRDTCLVADSDTLFASGSSKLTATGRRELADFFKTSGAFGYAIYGHTDSAASDAYNDRLSKRRAAAVAVIARSVGASVEREIGYGERNPVATNATAAGMRQNRRVEIVCYRW